MTTGPGSQRSAVVFVLIVVMLSATVSALSYFGPYRASAPNSEAPVEADVANPQIVDGRANVTFPSDYDLLAEYTLGLINSERTITGGPPLTLSNLSVAQQHSDSMLYYGYYSAWDTQGYGPYVRYTLMGGTGAVRENIGLDYCTDSLPSATVVTISSCTLQTIEAGIENLQWGLVYNDLGCCNNADSNNVLDPSYNQVSIGISFNVTTAAIYLVEDFQNDRAHFETPTVTPDYQVTLNGSAAVEENASLIWVYYQHLPQALNTSQLDSTSDYGPGTFVGTVYPPCESGAYFPVPSCRATSNYVIALSVFATSWQVTPGSISITFPLSYFIDSYGAGVYTIYLQTGVNSTESLLTYSIFVTNA